MKRSTILWLVLGLWVLNGCAYYNTFYNTKKYFKEALEEHKKRRGDKPSSVEKQKFDKTIKQASKVLQLYPDSKYIDDSLMILGQSFFYVEDYRKAQRKFEELLQIFPNSEYAPEARLWLAKTRVKLRDFSQAEMDLRDIIENSRNKGLRREAQYWLGECYYLQEKWREAVDAFKIAVKKIKDKDLKYRTYLRLGECFNEVKEFEASSESYRLAARNTDDLEKKFQAELDYGRSLLRAEKYGEAIRIFSNIIEVYFNNRQVGLAKLEMANAMMKRGNVQEALEWYKTITEEHPRTPAAAGAYLALGEYQETVERNYKAAGEYYQKARLQDSRSEYAKKAVQKSDLVKRLMRIKNDIKRTKTQIAALEKRYKSLKDHPQKTDDQKPDDRAETVTKNKRPKPRKPKLTPKQIQARIDSLNRVVARKKVELAEVFLFQFDKVDSAMNQYMDILVMTDDPQIRALAFYSLAYIFEQKMPEITLRDSLLQVLAYKYPDTPQGRQAARLLGLKVRDETVHPEEQHYQMAEQILFDRGSTDLALRHLEWILKNSKDKDWRAKALYLMGWIYEHRLNKNQLAYESYKKLADDFPKSPLVRKIRRKIYIYEQKQRELAAAADSAKQTTAGVAKADSAAEPKVRKKEFASEIDDELPTGESMAAPSADQRRKLLDDEMELVGLKKKPVKGQAVEKPAAKSSRTDSTKRKKKIIDD
ncbi:MAG: tetratricopeptide repeat protein [candidate division KSB1 bacterium]|nr:tetratricopeptide repeat protein [candidate division KSB1 bacterium]